MYYIAYLTYLSASDAADTVSSRAYSDYILSITATVTLTGYQSDCDSPAVTEIFIGDLSQFSR